MINLLPYKEKKSIERIRMIRIIQAVVVGMAVLIVVSAILLIPTLITIRSRFSIASNQISALESGGSLASDVDLSVLESRAKSVRDILAIPEKPQVTDYIDIVRSIVPSSVTIERFSSENENLLEVFGTAESREILQDFINKLEAQESIALVDSPVSNFIKNKNGSFKLTISFKTQ